MAKRNSLTHRRLTEVLRYEPDTGLFFWLVDGSNGVKAGQEAGTFNANNYVVITIGRKCYYAHRLAWFYMRKRWPRGNIDHRNGTSYNNRWENLRDTSQSVNMQNLRCARSDNKLGVLGVCLEKSSGRYKAQITIDGKNKCLGRFNTPAIAHAAYLAAKRIHHAGCTL
jgi:hypothetical protein